MKEGKAKSGNKGLVILLCVLLVAIVGLGVGIGVVVNYDGEITNGFDNVSAGVSALEASEYIENNFNNDLEYSAQDAIADYEREMEIGDSARRVYVAMAYADFVYSLYGDIGEATEIMSRVSDLLETDELAIDYFVAMRGFYERAGNSEEAELYNQKVVELVPARDMTEKEIESEGLSDG